MNNIQKQLHQHKDRLIELIYRSAVESSCWQALLSELVTILEGCSARLLFMDGTAKLLYASYTVNLDEKYYRQYVDYYINICPWRREFHLKPAGRLYSTYLDFEQEYSFYYRSEFYNDWARPQGLVHGLCGNVIATPDFTVQLLLQRSSEPGYFTREETAAVNDFLLHMQRSLALQRQIEQERGVRGGIVDAKKRNNLPSILLNERLNIVHMDDDVISLLSTYTELRIVNGKLSLQNERLNGRLQRLLKGCAAVAQGDWNHAGGCLRLQDEGLPLEIHVHPIHPSYKGDFQQGGYYVALYINNLAGWYALNAQLVRESFGLSPAELRLAEAICNGQTLDNFAATNGTTLNTVRSQLKQLFAKTGVSRQAELTIRLLPYLR